MRKIVLFISMLILSFESLAFAGWYSRPQGVVGALYHDGPLPSTFQYWSDIFKGGRWVEPASVPGNVAWRSITSQNGLHVLVGEVPAPPLPRPAPPPPGPSRAELERRKVEADRIERERKAEQERKAEEAAVRQKEEARVAKIKKREAQHAESLARLEEGLAAVNKEHARVAALQHEKDSAYLDAINARIAQEEKALCFPGETPISVQNVNGDGYHAVPIQSIQPGDLVFSCNLTNERHCSSRRVLEKKRSVSRRLMRLRMGGQILRVTEMHPFYLVDKKEWVKARELKPGVQLLTVFGTSIELEDIQSETGRFTVYNLEVEENQNYFAGKVGVLVHNCNLREAQAAARRAQPAERAAAIRMAMADVEFVAATTGVAAGGTAWGAVELGLEAVATFAGIGASAVYVGTAAVLGYSLKKGYDALSYVFQNSSEEGSLGENTEAPSKKIYHRKEGPTQTREVAKAMEESRELWGRPPRFSHEPAVQAHEGPLPEGERGVEFTTEVPPDKGGVPKYPRWTIGREGVSTKETPQGDFATIPIRIIKNTQQ